MPTYEYVCTSCQNRLEVVQSIHEPSRTDCAACGDGRLRKVFGNVGVVFKGSGFYRNDSRKKSTAASTATPRTESKDSKESKKAASDAGGNGSSGDSAGGKSGAGQGTTGSTTSSQKAAAAAAS